MEFDDAVALLAALEEEDVAYVLVGALAMAAHGEVRATDYIDPFVASDPANVARLRRALTAAFDDPEIAEIADDDLAGEYSVIRYVPPSGDFATRGSHVVTHEERSCL